MRFLGPDRKIISVLFVLAVTQVIGWGTVSLPAIIGQQVAAGLGMSIEAAFAGSSVLYVVMGLWAPVLAKGFMRFGARRVMMAGAVLAAAGFVLLSVSTGPVLYFAAWVILGTAGSATLTTAAYIMLNEIAGRKAKSAIGALMLVTGLSSSIFWPTTAFLSAAVGWRGTCLVYAAMMVLVCLPFYVFGLPRRAYRGEATSPSAPATGPTTIARKGTFALIVTAIALNAFVTFGFSAVLIELLQAEGLPKSQAIAFGSMLGVIQVCARGLDFVGGGRWDGITTGLVAGICLPVAMLLLIVGDGIYWTVPGFILIYGLGSGALAVSRATIPLLFYDKAEFAKATSRIALPLNLISAASPPIFISLLTQFGSHVLLGLASLCSCGALLNLFLLSRRRPSVEAIVLQNA
ncbi:MFS transporter [Agrobacterium vitis]|uniref:MFS transporter n=1 Tax=Agrobacterium vitis TaxID=373 RepID=A0A109CUB6_AGRVI|nr:MFS transporter [Agrobacterium vitis]KAA3506487.1 MFS transporter [Agrobacterium vitis]KAA3520955.1 MFS transporter [Agrobacterium vitis]MCF1479821.1 MFS transporter [Agrobacterium vitis]MUO80847.1 MFS transporter [Agrobacterium vitis]MUO94755.1 MFS transporter [Agrobacterium vitis]